MIACVTSAADSASETISTLRFAAAASWVKTAPLHPPRLPSKKRLIHEDTTTAEASTLDSRAHDVLAANAARSSELGLFMSDACGIHEPVSVPLTYDGSSHALSIYGDFRAGCKAPLAVLLHYYGAGSAGGAYWKPWFSALRSSGWRVLAPSFPGHGGTPGAPLSARPEPATLRGVPCALLFSLLDALGEPSVALCGLDWGAGVALEAALRQPNRVTHVIPWAASYRDADGGARLGTLPQRLARAHGISLTEARERLAVLWGRRDPMHSYARGRAIAATLSTSMIDCDTDRAACDALVRLLGSSRSDLVA